MKKITWREDYEKEENISVDEYIMERDDKLSEDGRKLRMIKKGKEKERGEEEGEYGEDEKENDGEVEEAEEEISGEEKGKSINENKKMKVDDRE